MSDLFEQNGINFQSSSMASTHPGTTPTPITAPHLSSGEKDAAVQSLFGSDVPQGDFKQSLTAGNAPGQSGEPAPQFTANAPSVSPDAAPAPQNGHRDLFQESGIEAPTIPDQNGNAVKDGLDVPFDSTPPAPVSSGPVSRSTMSLPPEMQQEQSRREQKAAADAIADKQNMIESARKIYGDDTVDGWLKSPIGPVEALQSAVTQHKTLPFAGGLETALSDARLQRISTAFTNNEPLSDADRDFAAAYVHSQFEQGVRGFTRGGKLAYSAVQIPAWMFEFAAADGLGAVAGARIAGAAARGGETAAAVSGAASRTALTSMLMPAQYIPQYAERRINATTAITDKGELIAKQSTESPALSALMAYGYTSADVASALAGPGINKYVVEPGTKLLSTPVTAAARALPATVREGIYTAWKAINPSASYSTLLTPAGWNSALSSIGSFQLDRILRTSLDYGAEENLTLGDALKRMPLDEDELLLAGGLVAIHGGVSAGSSVVSSLLKSKGATPEMAGETVANMSEVEKDKYANDNLKFPMSPYPAAESVEAAKDIAPVGADKQLPSYLHADAEQVPTEKAILDGQTQAQEAAAPPPIQEESSGFNAGYKDFKKNYLKPLYAELFNDVQPIEDLSRRAMAAGAEIPAGERSDLLTSFVRSTPEWIRRNQMVNTTAWDAEGNQHVTGKSMKAIYDDFDNHFLTTEPSIKARHADFENFLVADRLLEEGKNRAETGALVTEEQLATSAQHMKELADKYGEDFRFFNTYADELRKWDNRILHNLVTSGLKSQEWYDQVTSARQKYSPLQRVVDEDFSQSAITARNGLGADNAPSRIGSLKQFKGSTKEIKNTFQSRLKSSSLILQKSAANQLRRSIAKYTEFYPEDVKVSNPAITQKEVTVAYDPKLRQKLEAAAEHFGIKIERNVDMANRMHGSFNEMENLIQLRRGSTGGTEAHEVGHGIDTALGLQEKLLSDPKIRKELENLARDRLSSDIKLQDTPEGNHFAEEYGRVGKKYEDYIKKDPELIANMFDAFVNSPEQFGEVAPKAKAAFEKLIDANPDLAFIKDIKPSTARASEVIQKMQRDMEGPKNSIPFYENGSRKYLELSPEIFKAFNNMKPIEMGMVERFLGGIFRGSTKLLRFGATSYPAFVMRHAYRATFTSFINTKGRPTPEAIIKHWGIELPKGIFAVLGRTENYHEWASSSGAFQTFMDLSDKGLAKLQSQAFSDKNPLRFFNPGHWLEVMKNVGDQGARIAVFNKAKEAGKSDLEAGIMSLEATGNYGRHGSFVKRVNQYAPFFNDMMQGGDRAVRSAMKDPASFSLKAIATLTIPQMVITGYYLFAADDKTRDEYLNFPDWSKGAFMHVKVGDQWIPLPRPFAPGFVFGALPEKIMIHMSKGYHPEVKNFWLNMLAETATSVSPVFDWSRAMNPIMKSALESMTNYSFFRQMPLFSGDLHKTAPSHQFNQYTSETAKLVGKMFDISPANIDNTVQDMAAQIGKYGLQLTDAGINAARKAQGIPVAEKPSRVTENPLYGKLLAETPRGTNTESFNEFRQHVNDATQAHNQLKGSQGQEAADFQKDNARLLAAYPGAHAAETQIHHLLKQIRTINSNTNMSADDKKTAEQGIENQITHIAEGANQHFRAATGQQ